MVDWGDNQAPNTLPGRKRIILTIEEADGTGVAWTCTIPNAKVFVDIERIEDERDDAFYRDYERVLALPAEHWKIGFTAEMFPGEEEDYVFVSQYK